MTFSSPAPFLAVQPRCCWRLPDFANGGAARSEALRAEYARAARLRAVELLDCNDVEGCVACSRDGIHLDAPAHKALSGAVASWVQRLLACVPVD